MAGIAVGLYQKETLFSHREYIEYNRKMDINNWKKRMDRWYDALALLLSKEESC